MFQGMKLKAYLETEGVTQVDVAAIVGCDQSFISKVCADDRPKPFPRRLAIKLYRAKGVKVEPIAEASDDEIAVLERFENERAA